MRWKKLGKIFDPTEFKLANDCNQFAQAPQTLIFDHFVRIYFSTRSFDINTKKFLSHIAFVDFSKDFKKILDVSTKTVIPLGETGCFDEHGIFPLNVLRHHDQIYGYIGGINRRLSVPVDSAIGLAVSHDNGLTFQRLGKGPVLAASLQEPCLIADAFVRVDADVFHMWYIFGSVWRHFDNTQSTERIYKIGHATSVDGIEWKKEEGRQIIDDLLGPDECQALPTVIKIDGRLHMYFCYRHASDFRTNKARAYRIGHAYSDDHIHWIRDSFDFEPIEPPKEWDSDMQCYPHVFECDGKIYMLYNGNEFGRYGFGLAELHG